MKKASLLIIFLLFSGSCLFGQSEDVEYYVPDSPFEGYFIDFEVGDYIHSVFRLKDGSETSLWGPGDEALQKTLVDNRGKLLKIYYKINKVYIPEAQDTLKLEILDKIEFVK